MIFPQSSSCEVTKRKNERNSKSKQRKRYNDILPEMEKIRVFAEENMNFPNEIPFNYQNFPQKIILKFFFITHTHTHWSHAADAFKIPAFFTGSREQPLPILPLPLQLSGVGSGKLPRLGLDRRSRLCRKFCNNSNKISFSHDNYQIKFSTLLIFIKLTLLYKTLWGFAWQEPSNTWRVPSSSLNVVRRNYHCQLLDTAVVSVFPKSVQLLLFKWDLSDICTEYINVSCPLCL